MHSRIGLLLNTTDQWGRAVFSVGTYAGKVSLMVYLSLRAAIVDQAQGFRSILSVVSAQIYFTGVQALPLMSVLALGAGSIVVMQASLQLSFLGGSEMLGKLLVVVIVREMAPLLTALIVIARSGTAVASELGSMRVNREIEALESMGINPLSYIVFPRLLGGIISVLGLAIHFTGMALIGGYFVGGFILNNMPLSFYWASLANAFAAEDVGLFIVKNLFSGSMIFAICSERGLNVKSSPHEVPQMTTAAVMTCIFYVIGFNMLLSIWFYLSQIYGLGLV